MEKIQGLLKSDRIREIIRYGIVGVLTTLVNYVAYFCITRGGALLLGIPAETIPQQTVLVQIANILGWILSVLFAFFANRRLVFRSSGEVKKELPTFVVSRLLSLGFDALFLLGNGFLFGMNDLVAKLISNVIVIVLNYFTGKFWVFRNRNKK